MKSVFGVIGALVAVLYCGGLIYYFVNGAGSVEDAQSIGLGPTLLGLGLIGLLFCVVLVVKIARVSIGTRSSGSGWRGGLSATTNDGEGEGEFDADAAVRRYMARQSAEAAGGSPAAPSTISVDGQARPTFGRKVRQPT